MSPKLVNRRIRLLLALLALAFAGTLGRAVWLQGVRAAPLARLARVQQQGTLALPATRGTIYDRTGIQLAIAEQATTVYANPKQIRNPRAVAVAAGRALGLDPTALYPLLADRSHGFVYVDRQGDPAKAATLAKEHLPGLGFYPEERRMYPQHTVAAQVLGFAGLDDHGLAGLELSLDHTLSGRPGSETIVRDPAGRVLDVVSQKAPLEGHDVFLALDSRIQANAEAVLRDTVARWGAKAGTAVVLDPRTGEVLAMAGAPGFDASRYGSAPAARWQNRAVTDVYEPGSTFKVVTVGGALTDGLVTPQTSFPLPYAIHVADRTIRDAEVRPTERMTVAQILSRSSNVGAITIAEKLGKERLAGWISRFGFGHPTGLDFPAESPGLVLAPDRWSGSTIGNVPIGQGVAVTPIQMAAAYAAIANGGVWTQPRLIERIGSARPRPVVRRRIVPPQVAAQLVAMLKNVVLDGTGTSAAIPHYQVAGKTGTAQKPDAHGGYSSSKYVASFVGMVPASKPRFVVLVAIDEPHGAIFGGTVAAPAFAQIAKFDLQYLSVRPDAPAGAVTPSG